ncbi:Protein of unknown function [Lactobacillus delbrueckii subsp. lactis]|nr:Protein of unknown function [Lactobacillus delbrueckii subsp. lactis]
MCAEADKVLGTGKVPGDRKTEFSS